MSAIITSIDGVQQKRVTYMSYPYTWRPTILVSTGQRVAAPRVSKLPGTTRKEDLPVDEHKRKEDLPVDEQGRWRALAVGTPPSLNAKPPYFAGHRYAQRVGKLGLIGTGSAKERDRPTSATRENPRPSTAERQREARSRRQACERKPFDGQLPVRFGVWEFMDPNLAKFDAHVRNIAQVQRPSSVSLTSAHERARSSCALARHSSAVPMVRPLSRPAARIGGKDIILLSRDVDQIVRRDCEEDVFKDSGRQDVHTHVVTRQRPVTSHGIRTTKGGHLRHHPSWPESAPPRTSLSPDRFGKQKGWSKGRPDSVCV